MELQEKGVIYQLYNKWWKNKEELCQRAGSGKETKTTLGVDSIGRLFQGDAICARTKNKYSQLGGVFVVLLCGLAVAVLIAIIEFCWNSRKSAIYEHVIY